MKRTAAIILAVAMLIPLCITVSAEEARFDIKKTDIIADSVVNYDGYGSLEIYEGKDESGWWDVYSHGVIGADGEMVIPYMETGRRFMYSDGIFSLTSGSVYEYGGNPEYKEIPTSYYGLDGKEIDLHSMVDMEKLFGPEEVSTADTEYSYAYYIESGPLTDGIAIFIVDRRMYAISEGVSNYSYDQVAALVDKDGDIRAILPAEFGEGLMATDMWTEYRQTLGYYREGLMAHFKYIEPEEYLYEFVVCGYINEVGETVLDVSDRGYEDLWPFYEGMALFRGANGNVGYIDDGAVEVVPAIYDYGSEFCDGMAYVRKDGKYGAIDKNGNVIIPLEYEISYGTGDGLMTVGADGKFGMIDKNGEYVIPIEFDDITPFRAGVAYAIKDGYVYIITEKALPEIEFTDVPEFAYYAAPVQWAVSLGITTGTNDGTTFSPEWTCTKEQILTFLWRAYGSPEPTVENPFSDVKANDYFYKPALWAYENGMVTGDTFNGKVDCTRSMTVLYLWQAAGAPDIDATDIFTDVSSDAEYAKAVAWAVEEGITTGTNDGSTFSPEWTCTRAQIVTFLWRNLGY